MSCLEEEGHCCSGGSLVVEDNIVEAEASSMIVVYVEPVGSLCDFEDFFTRGSGGYSLPPCINSQSFGTWVDCSYPRIWTL